MIFNIWATYKQIHQSQTLSSARKIIRHDEMNISKEYVVLIEVKVSKIEIDAFNS